MKRWILWVLTVVMLCSICTLGAVAETSKQAMDLVIIIDQSSSMRMKDDAGKVRGNDTLGYRMDAAAIMLSMCDMEDSRAALVLFNRNNTYFNGEKTLKFEDISKTGLSNRIQMIEWLDGQRTKTNPDTDIGQAMGAAVELFKQNPSDRQKTILLLTDGGHDIMKSDRLGARTTRNSEVDFENAIQWAADNDVRVYTIGLKAASGKSYDLYELQQAASRTGGSFLQAEKAENLPAFFNQFYAAEIQSAVVTLKGELNAELGENWYTVKIPVPNASVAEANIMVAHDQNTKGKTAVLYQPSVNGQPAIEMVPDRKKTFCFDTEYFSVYKMLNPAVGEWTLNYQSTDHAGVDINIIFSYNVEPRVFIDSDTVIGKTGSISAKALFYTADGKASNDMHLYADAAAYNLGGIDGVMTVTNADGMIVASVPMVKSAEDMMFRASVDFADNKLESGEYTIIATMTGAGMDVKSEAVTFTVENSAPVENASIKEVRTELAQIEIHDPRKDDYALEYEKRVDLSQYFTDPDADRLKYELVSEQKNVEANIVGADLVIRSKDAPADEIITVKATDSDRTAPLSVSVNLPVKVRNIRSEVQNGFAVKMMQVAGGTKKNETITLQAIVHQNDIQVTDAEWLNLMNVVLTCDDGTVIPLTCEDGVFKGSFTTADVERSYTFTAKAMLSDFAITADGSMTFSVGNKVPELNEEVAELLPVKAYINPFLWGKENDTQTQVVLSDLMTDTADDVLSFDAYLVPEKVMQTAIDDVQTLLAQKDEFETLKLVTDDDATMLTLNNDIAGERTVLLVATDLDGKTAEYLYTMEIISQKDVIVRLLMMGAMATMTFVILCIFVYWTFIRKSWTKKFGKLERNMGGAQHDPVDMPKSGKQDRKLSEVIRLGNLCDRTGDFYKVVNNKFAAQTKLRALSGQRIRVTVTALPKDLELKIGEKSVQRPGNYEWGKAATLSVKYNNTEVKFVRKPQTPNRTRTASSSATPAKRAPRV